MLDYAANYGLSQPVFVIIEMSGVIAARDDHNLDSLGSRVLTLVTTPRCCLYWIMGNCPGHQMSLY